MLMVNLNTRFSRRVSMYANYTLNFANDLPQTPSDPYDFALDWGRSNLDRRNNLQLVGSVVAPLGLRLAPFITIRSGAPYDVLLGTDLYGDTFYNARPAFAAPGACLGGGVGTVKCTPLGDFSANVLPGAVANLVPRNYLTMANMVSVNMRVYRVFGFGPVRGGGGGAANNGAPQGGLANVFGGGGGRGGRGGGRGRGGSGGETTEHRYNVTLGMDFTNVLNHFNPAGYQGVLTSTQFGEPTTVNTGFGGGFAGGGNGFGGVAAGSTANNRRIEFQLRFAF
jgi:hypothetical protein